MEPKLNELFRIRSGEFQYPLSDRVRWNATVIRSEARGQSCFSILYRIELGGTHFFVEVVQHIVRFSILYRIELGGTEFRLDFGEFLQEFQYPLSDRVRWNELDPVQGNPQAVVSVSSIGSS